MGFFSKIGQNIADTIQSGNGQSAYQFNLQTVKAPEPKQETTRSVLAKIYQVAENDMEKAKTYYNQFLWEQDQPNSLFYNPYTKPTNQAVSNLAAYGIDTSNIDDNWFEANSWLKKYYQTTGTTNNVKSPGKKASAEEKAAYQFNQIWAAEEQTKKAENEWAALQQELSYWAQRSDRNYSDDYIIDNIDWSKYKTLQKMDDTRKQGTPMELNRAVGYSKDAMYGVLWAARNDGGSGSLIADIAYSGQNAGNAWTYNQEIADKLNPKSDKFSPYSLGCTNLDDAAVYFNVASFGKDWLQQNSGLAWSNDETAKKMYQQVYKAEENQTKAEDELAKLNEYVDKKLKLHNGEDGAEWILNHIDWSNYPTLSAMDKSIGKNGAPGTGDLIPMTRGLDYRYADFAQYVYDKCAQNAELDSGVSYVEKNTGDEIRSSVPNMGNAEPVGGKTYENQNYAADITGASVPAEQQGIQVEPIVQAPVEPAKPKVTPVKFPDQVIDIMRKRDKTLSLNTELVEDTLSDTERDTFETTSAETEVVKEFWSGVDTGMLLEKNTAESAISYAGEMANLYTDVYAYNDAATNLPGIQTEIMMLESSVSATQDELDRLNTLKDLARKPDLDLLWLLRVRDDYENNTNNARVLGNLYSYVTGQDYDEQYDKNQIRDWADYIFNSDREMTETAYEGDKTSRMKDLQQAANQYQHTLEEKADIYAEYDQKRLWFDATIAAYEEAGLDTTELRLSQAMSTYLSDMAIYQPTVWSEQSYYQELAAEGRPVGEIDQIHEDQALLLDNARFVKAYIEQNNLGVSDQIRNNLDRYIAALERDEEDYQYYALQYRDDFAANVEAGKELEEQEQLNFNPNDRVIFDPGTKGTEIEVMAGLDKADYFPLMNADEINTYYYLYATGGRPAAYAYYQHLSDDTYGVLNVRQRGEIEELAEKEVNSGFFGGLWANTKAIASAPLEGILGLAYFIDRVLTGEEYNPNASALAFGHYSAKVNQETMQSIKDVCKDSAVVQTLVSGLYEILYNRGRSAMNAAVFNFFGPESNAIDMVKEFVGAAPMAVGAASMAAADAKDKGATDGQAYVIATATFFAEDLSEGLTYGNIQEAFGKGGFTPTTVKDFLKNWLTKSGVEEMLGETANEIIENLTDEYVMGELSEHAERVKDYQAKLKEENPYLSESELNDKAEELARRDEIAGLFHTALISYLSPGLDVISMPVRAAHDNLSFYRSETKRQQESGRDTNLWEVRQEYQDLKKNGKKNKKAEGSPAIDASTKGVGLATPSVQEAVGNAAVQALSKDAGVLDSVQKANIATQNAAVAKVLSIDGGTQEQSDMASAAAPALRSIFGGDQQKTVDGVKAIVSGAYAGGINGDQVKAAMRNAALSVSSQARAVMMSDEFKAATPEEKASMLAETIVKDTGDETVVSEATNAVTEWRIASEEANILSEDGSLSSTQSAKESVDAAAKETQAANERYEAASAEEEERNKEATDLTTEALANPTTENTNAAEQARIRLEHASKVTDSEANGVTAAQNRQEEAVTAYKQQAEKEMNAVRQQATETVALQDQQRATERVQQEEAARVQAEQEAQQQLAQDETANADVAVEDAFVEQWMQEHPEATPEDEQKLREVFREGVAEYRKENPPGAARDENGNLTDEARANRDQAMDLFRKKFKINIDFVDTKTEDGFYSEGYYDKDQNRIVLDDNLSLDDALYRVLGHELLHVAKNSKTYKQLANAVLRMAYGPDVNIDTVIQNLKENNGRATTQLEADLIENWQKRYAKVHKDTSDYEYFVEEMVADYMGTILNQEDDAQRQDLVNRLVAEDPGVARRMLDAIKRFLKQAVGMKGAWLTNTQKTVDMLEKALNQAQKGQQNETTTIATADDGEALATELPGGTVTLNTDRRYSLASFTPEEQEKVKKALMDSGLFTERQVNRYMRNALGVAATIAKDRARLDFDVTDENKSMVKPNSDYGASIDASTLCAKRLVYQGTFDAIQHALPNTPLLPEDLIHLADMMREMGYETPCGICYVESRRRNLGKYTAEWLENYQGEYVPTVDEVTTSDGLEWLRTHHEQAYNDFMDAMNSHGKQNNPKPVQLRTEYKGEIRGLSDRSKQKYINNGGIRLQSFSDFETPHLLDMMQVVMDIASKKLTAQAYTKVPNFAWVFGDTGIKINLSLIGKGEGVDENGNLLFDDVEGMPFEEAMKLREKYSKNVGTVLVGINDKQILAAMADPRIDYIIPFHSSGWTKEDMRLMPTLGKYEDYQNYQTEKDVSTGAKTTQNKGRNIAPVGEKDEYGNGYWDFKKSGKKNAETYLDLCYKNGLIPIFPQFLDKDSKGHYHLKKDGSTDGYWKLLIDFKMYDNKGKGAPQAVVTPNVNMAEAYRVLDDYKLERQQPGENTPPAVMKDNNSLPVAETVVDRFVKEYKESHPNRKYSLSQLTSLDQEYADAVANNDLQKATDMLMERLKNSEGIIPFNKAHGHVGKYAAMSKGIKKGDAQAIASAAEEMASFVPDNAVLIPMPPHTGKATDETGTMLLAKAIGELTGRPVVNALEGVERPSRFEQKNATGTAKVTAEEMGLRQVADIPEGTMPIFIDNTIGSGETAKAANLAMNGGITLSLTKGNRTRNHTEGLKQFAITYDDDGNLIPLSQRFDRSNPDVRYSLPAEVDQTIEDMNANDFADFADVENHQDVNYRYAKPEDAPYLSAVDHGDMEEAAKDVKEYAVNKGYTDEAYHGTNSFGFTEFDMDISQDEIFVSYNPSTAKTYTDNAGIREIGKPKNSPYNMTNEEIANTINSLEDTRYYGPYIIHANPVSQEEMQSVVHGIFSDVLNVLDGKQWSDGNYTKEVMAASAEYNGVPATKEELLNCETPKEMAELCIEKFVDPENFEPGKKYYSILDNLVFAYAGTENLTDLTRKLNNINDYMNYAYNDYFFDSVVRLEMGNGGGELFDAYESNANLANWLEKKLSRGIYKFYTRPGKQLVVNGAYENWNRISWDAIVEADPAAEGEHTYDYLTKTREIAKWARDHGYDSVRINNVYDHGGQSGNRESALGDIGIFFNQKDVKSADTVTYDDNGDIIPLSERFTDEEKDFRYSLPSDDVLRNQIRQYLANGGALAKQTNLPGNPVAEEDGSAQRQFGSRTAQRSDALHQEVKDYLFTHSSYVPDSNQAQIDRAIDWVQGHASTNDQDGYYAAVDEVTADNFDYRSADGQARMLTVMSMAALKGDLSTELRLADAYNKQGTDLGRQLQARKIFRLMTPIGRQSVLQNMADQINDQLGRKGLTVRVALSDETMEMAGNAQSEEDFEKVRKRAAKEIAAQVPANWKDKLRGWRMLSMLGNPRTHIRNIIGNAMFVPVVSLKNKMGALGEIITRQDERTKTLSPVVSKAVRDFVKEDVKTMKDTLTGEAKYNETTMVEREQKAFRGLLQALIDFNSGRLEAEDWHFLRNHYKRALGGWMQANGYTEEQLRKNPSLLEKGRAYAVQEAQKATYRDFSKLAQALNKVSRDGGVAGFITDAVLPFKKTPANILKRGVEYSPAGIMRSLTTDLYHLKQWNDYESGKLKTLPEKAISPNQFIDRLCSGLSGTIVLAVGALLNSAGIVTCGLDDDEDKLEKEKGNQEYAIKFSIGGKDYTFTLDWAAPMSMPFFVGAALQEQLSQGGEVDVEQLVNAFGNITEPVFNLSMLDGVNTLFKTSQYDDTNTITQIGAKVISNYATSYVPSFVGAVARTADDTRRKSFVESGKGTGVLGTFRYAREQVENKIPGLSQTNIPARDIFGNAETSEPLERILENFILPGYVSEYKNDPVLNEMARLYEATGENAMIPKDPDKSVTYKKQKYVLSAEDWDQYKTVRGQTAYEGLTQLLSSEDYQEANETTQAQMVKDVWSYADKVGKQAVIPDFEMEDMGVNPIATVAKDAKIESYKSDMMKSLASGDYEGYATMVEALEEIGVEDSEIKTKISGVYRDKYKEAYRKGNEEQMAEIEEILDNTGFNFDINAWEDQVDEKYNR